MNVKNYCQMLENVHVIVNKKEKEQFNFWRGEAYQERDFEDACLKIEMLLQKEWCKKEK